MAYKQRGFASYLQKFGIVKVLGVLFLVSAVAIGIVLANDPNAITFNSGASSKPLTFDQAVKLTGDGQGFKVTDTKDRFNGKSFTIEGWVKLNATPPLTHPEVIFKVGNTDGESAAAKGNFVVYVAPPSAVNPHAVPTLGTLVVAMDTLPSNTEPRGGYRLFDAGPITTERDAKGNFLFGKGLFDQQWHHLAVTVSQTPTNQRRWGTPTVVTVFLDGKITIPGVFLNNKPVGSWTAGEINYGSSTNSLFVGADVFGTPQTVKSFEGQIDEVRYSKSVRYTRDFEPSNRPFKDDGNTITILHLDGSIVPAARTNGAVTVLGAPGFDASFQ